MYVHVLVILSWLKEIFPQNGPWGGTGCLTNLINNASVIILLEFHNQQAEPQVSLFVFRIEINFTTLPGKQMKFVRCLIKHFI